MDGDAVIDLIAQQLIRLGRIRERTNAQLAAAAKGEVELAAYGIIFRLLCDGPMRSGALAEAMFSDASTISRQVASLVKKGLIERQADPADGRASVLVVTDAGRAQAAEIRRRRNETLDRVLAGWDRDERAQFGTLLRRFVDDYETARPAILTLHSNMKDSATEKDS